MTELQLTCADYVGTALLPSLIRDFESVLGTAGETWRLDIDSEDPQTLLFAYPNGLTIVPRDVQSAGPPPRVRRPLGLMAGHGCGDPAHAADHVPEAFEGATNCTVQALAAKRTFWEKATLLHAVFHRPEVRPGAEKLSRHYYDLAMLATTPVLDEALSDLELLSRVAEHKTQFSPAAWARYDLAKPGSLRLVPHEALAKMLARDYGAMKEMVF